MVQYDSPTQPTNTTSTSHPMPTTIASAITQQETKSNVQNIKHEPKERQSRKRRPQNPCKQS